MAPQVHHHLDELVEGETMKGGMELSREGGDEEVDVLVGEDALFAVVFHSLLPSRDGALSATVRTRQ
jgi:hypothetical protein